MNDIYNPSKDMRGIVSYWFSTITSIEIILKCKYSMIKVKDKNNLSYYAHVKKFANRKQRKYLDLHSISKLKKKRRKLS